jgi:hypothetical protein
MEVIHRKPELEELVEQLVSRRGTVGRLFGPLSEEGSGRPVEAWPIASGARYGVSVARVGAQGGRAFVLWRMDSGLPSF